MESVEYKPIKDLLLTALASLFWGFLVSFNILWNFIRLGPSKFFWTKDRTNRPEILDDPELGTHHFARLKNIRLHYVAKGSEGRPLMLFLHGFPEFWYSWRHQLKEFGNDYRAVAVDLPGFSESDRPYDKSNYDLRNLADNIKDFVDYIGYRKCIIVAHDWGGLLSWVIAARYPDMVERVVTCNGPHPFAFADHIKKSWKQFKMSWYVYVFQLPWMPYILLSSMDFTFLSTVFKPAMSQKHFNEEDVNAFKYNMKSYADFAGGQNYYRALLHYQIDHFARCRVQCKTLIVWGRQDAYVDHATAEMSTKYVDNECQIKYIDNASHWVQQEEPELVNQYIREFLK